MSFLAISMQRSLQGSKVYMRLYFCHAKDHAFDSFSTRTYGVWRVTLPLRAYIYIHRMALTILRPIQYQQAATWHTRRISGLEMKRSKPIIH